MKCHNCNHTDLSKLSKKPQICESCNSKMFLPKSLSSLMNDLRFACISLVFLFVLYFVKHRYGIKVHPLFISLYIAVYFMFELSFIKSSSEYNGFSPAKLFVVRLTLLFLLSRVFLPWFHLVRS